MEIMLCPSAWRRNPRIWSRPSYEYFPSPYALVASSAKHSSISFHRFRSRQRTYLYLSRLIASISCRSTMVGSPFSLEVFRLILDSPSTDADHGADAGSSARARPLRRAQDRPFGGAQDRLRS